MRSMHNNSHTNGLNALLPCPPQTRLTCATLPLQGSLTLL